MGAPRRSAAFAADLPASHDEPRAGWAGGGGSRRRLSRARATTPRNAAAEGAAERAAPFRQRRRAGPLSPRRAPVSSLARRAPPPAAGRGGRRGRGRASAPQPPRGSVRRPPPGWRRERPARGRGRRRGPDWGCARRGGRPGDGGAEGMPGAGALRGGGEGGDAERRGQHRPWAVAFPRLPQGGRRAGAGRTRGGNSGRGPRPWGGGAGGHLAGVGAELCRPSFVIFFVLNKHTAAFENSVRAGCRFVWDFFFLFFFLVCREVGV